MYPGYTMSYILYILTYCTYIYAYKHKHKNVYTKVDIPKPIMSGRFYAALDNPTQKAYAQWWNENIEETIDNLNSSYTDY